MKGKAHIPTEKTKAEVIALKSFGTTDEDIAKYIGISGDALTARYRRELDTAVTQANAEVASKLFKKATKGDDVTAQIFWLKTRGRWRSEDNKNIIESNDELKQQIMELRAKLDAQNKRDY